jgi:hypothetical protein
LCLTYPDIDPIINDIVIINDNINIILSSIYDVIVLISPIFNWL